MPNTIILKGEFIRKNGAASGTITPGHLIERGGTNDIQVHSTAAGAPAQRSWAIENDPVGGGITDDYLVGETVQYGVFDGGAEVYAWLAAGANAAKGDKLVSAGDGSLEVMASGGEAAAVVAIATEAVNNSTGSFAVRISVEVL